MNSLYVENEYSTVKNMIVFFDSSHSDMRVLAHWIAEFENLG